MQRLLPLLFSLLALYACSGTVPHKPEEEKPTPAATAPATAAVEPPVDELMAPASATAEPPAEVISTPLPEPTVTPFPHIALLLPLQSKVFGSSAEAVQQGFMAAINPKRLVLPVRVYSDFDENNSIVNAYRQAIANGARAVVGPLTRSGVSALAAESYIPVPTLALNIVDSQSDKPLYFFGMAIESEARQAAQLAKQNGLHQAIIITIRSPVSKRLQSAFEEEWNGSDTSRGILREVEFSADTDAFADIADITDTAVFLAADADKARLIRPYLPNKMPIYATSQIFVGNDKSLTNYDLNGIRFVDMPWLLQPDHPAVMIYPHANPPLTIDRERLYALGIDSFRLIEVLLENKTVSALPLDGVSGKIQLYDHTFQRVATPAIFVQGRAQLPDAPLAPVAPMFPERALTTP